MRNKQRLSSSASEMREHALLETRMQVLCRFVEDHDARVLGSCCVRDNECFPVTCASELKWYFPVVDLDSGFDHDVVGVRRDVLIAASHLDPEAAPCQLGES